MNDTANAKPKHGLLNFLLDFGPLLLFFVALFVIVGGVVAVMKTPLVVVIQWTSPFSSFSTSRARLTEMANGRRKKPSHTAL